jgi:predicted dehydrogenase
VTQYHQNTRDRRKVLFEYSSAVLEIENAKEGWQSNPAPSAPAQTVPSSKGTVHVDRVRIETEDKDDFDDHSDDFNGEDIDDDDDEDEGSGPEDEDESEEDEDGGFFDSEEGGKDDPLEHALDAMLDIEAEANTAHKKARKK